MKTNLRLVDFGSCVSNLGFALATEGSSVDMVLRALSLASSLTFGSSKQSQLPALVQAIAEWFPKHPERAQA